MKPTNLGVATLVVLMLVQASAAPFQNLGFDEAQTNSLTPHPFVRGAFAAPISDLLPGWNLSLGSQQVTMVGFDVVRQLAGLATAPSLELPGTSLAFRDGYWLSLMTAIPSQYFLSQRGDIPAGTKFLDLRATGNNTIIASINGEDLVSNGFYPMFPEYRADVSKFAGLTVDLTLRTVFPESSRVFLDSIAFTVPEPSTYALLALGASALAGRWLWRRRRSFSG